MWFCKFLRFGVSRVKEWAKVSNLVMVEILGFVFCSHTAEKELKLRLCSRALAGLVQESEVTVGRAIRQVAPDNENERKFHWFLITMQTSLISAAFQPMLGFLIIKIPYSTPANEFPGHLSMRMLMSLFSWTHQERKYDTSGKWPLPDSLLSSR